MKTKVGTLALLATAAILLSGCGDQAPPQTTGPDGSDKLPGRAFVSTKVTDAGKPRDLVDKTKISMQFTDDGRLIANAGCNTMQSEVDTGDGKLSMPEGLSITEMGCDPPRHKQDTWLADVLSATPSWRLDKDSLVVTSGETELVLQDREVAEPDAALEGTKWIVTTYVDGDAASHKDYADLSQAPHLTFANGEVTGTGGCNSFSGKATISGDTITFEPIITTKMACENQSRNDDETHILNVLNGKVTYDVSSNSLQLDNPNGKGLGLDKSK